MHVRPPSIAPGVKAFVWGLLLGAYIWGGLLSVGITGATAFIVGAVSGWAIFLYVRVYGGDERQAPRREERAR